MHIIYTHKSCQSTNLSPQTKLCWRVGAVHIEKGFLQPSWVDQKDEAQAGISLAPSSKKIVLALQCQQLVSLPSLPEKNS